MQDTAFLETKSFEKTIADWIYSKDALFEEGHRFDHIDRVVQLARKIAIAEQADLKIVIPAAYLHDCFPVSKKDPRRKQASTLSAQCAKEFLEDIAYPKEYIDPIMHAIAAHSYSSGIKAQTLEAKVVQDADRLDALGAIGIARVFALGGQFNSSLYHPKDPFCREGKYQDDCYILDHFYTKLLKIKDMLHTKEAQKIGAVRHQQMLTFIKELGENIQGS